MMYWPLFPSDKFEEKMECGIVFYNKPKKNIHTESHKKTMLNRRITTMRVRTHTCK